MMLPINATKRPEAPIVQTPIWRPSAPDVPVGEEIVVAVPLEVPAEVLLELPLDAVVVAVAVADLAVVDRVVPSPVTVAVAAPAAVVVAPSPRFVVTDPSAAV
jgi:hypothetical protein